MHFQRLKMPGASSNTSRCICWLFKRVTYGSLLLTVRHFLLLRPFLYTTGTYNALRPVYCSTSANYINYRDLPLFPVFVVVVYYSPETLLHEISLNGMSAGHCWALGKKTTIRRKTVITKTITPADKKRQNVSIQSWNKVDVIKSASIQRGSNVDWIMLI